MPFLARFAPSPNGRLHLGHAFSALLNAEAAQTAGGRFLLRIENIDATRSRTEFEAAIMEDLDWLGILPPDPPRRQSDHLGDYGAALARLDRLGLVYPAFETRAEIARAVAAREQERPWPRDPDGAPLFPFPRDGMSDRARAARRAAGAPFALRLDMARALAAVGQPLCWREAQGSPLGLLKEVAAAPQDWGDVILARKDSPASYHLAVVVDDALQGITHVIRGQDLTWSTSVHRLLQALLDLPAPIYHHHRLILDGNGRKLAKSVGSPALADLRAAGAAPGDIRRMLSFPAQATPRM